MPCPVSEGPQHDPEMAADEAKIACIAAEIERYLESHPRAADSMEGIRQWWFARLRVEEGAMQVSEALRLLLARGVVVEKRLPDGTLLYAAAVSRETST
jgi:hypothetical protein